MTVSTRVPAGDMKGIIARALSGGDYEHDAEWYRPLSCSCHAGAQSCLLPADAGSCEGRAVEVATPPEHVVTAEILAAALPESGADGTIGVQEAAGAIFAVIGERLTGDYILRAHSLQRRLTAAAGEYEQENGLADSSEPEDAGPAPRCQACGKALPAGSRVTRKTCSDSCRATLMRLRRKGKVTQLPSARVPL